MDVSIGRLDDGVVGIVLDDGVKPGGVDAVKGVGADGVTDAAYLRGGKRIRFG